MAELTLAPPRDRAPVKAIVIAALALAAVAAAVFFLIPRETARLTVTGVQTFAPRTEFKPGRSMSGINIVGQETTTEDDLYVVATVHLQDQFRMPVSVDGMSGTLALSNGAVQQGSSVARVDVERLEAIFPALTPMIHQPVGFGDEVAPGKALDGQVILQFPGVNADAWQARKSATLTIAMHNQPAQTVTLP